MAVAGKVAITLSTENGGAWSADVTYDRLVAVKHNNSLYISRKVVTNVEPPNDEFWFLALEGYSGEDVQALINRMNDIITGTTQVGNAKTLDGHGASYFATDSDLVVERERISNLAKLNEGSTTGDAELIDARVGADGKTYDNVGDALRGQVGELKGDLDTLKSYSDTVFEQGAIYGGVDDNSNVFIRTKGIIKNRKILIKNNANFAFVIVAYYYSDNGIFLESAPSEILLNVGESYVFEPTHSNFRLRVGKGGSTEITPSDVSGMFKNITSVTYNSVDRDRNKAISLQYKDIMIGFAHRGASNVAPENTASAFKMASKLGYIAIETDFRFTSDGVPVIIHDAQVDRTSNLNGNVSNMTLAQLKAGDFGSWFSSEFTGEKILTFDECIKLCKQLGLIVVMEQKQWLEADRIKQVCDIVKKYDMCDSVWWVGDTVSIIVQFANNIPNATIGYVVDDIPSEYEAKLDALKNASDKVYISMRNTKITEERASILRNKGIKLYAWTIDDEEEILKLNPYVSGVFSNRLNAPVVLNERN